MPDSRDGLGGKLLDYRILIASTWKSWLSYTGVRSILDCEYHFLVPFFILLETVLCALTFNLSFSIFFISLKEILEGVMDIDLVVNLKLREEALVAKCLGRRICSECGGNYNVACINIKAENGSPGMYMAPLLPPSHCESKLITRPDDTEEVVKERLRIYNEMVFSIVSWCLLIHSLEMHWHTKPFLCYSIFHDIYGTCT